MYQDLWLFCEEVFEKTRSQRVPLLKGLFLLETRLPSIPRRLNRDDSRLTTYRVWEVVLGIPIHSAGFLKGLKKTCIFFRDVTQMAQNHPCSIQNLNENVSQILCFFFLLDTKGEATDNMLKQMMEQLTHVKTTNLALRDSQEVSSTIFQWSGWWFLASWILSCCFFFCLGFYLYTVFGGIQCVVSRQQTKCFLSGGTFVDIMIDTVDETLHHLRCRKPCKQWDVYHINWCRFLAINSMSTIIDPRLMRGGPNQKWLASPGSFAPVVFYTSGRCKKEWTTHDTPQGS